MGTFTSPADAPDKLCKEAAEITLTFDRTSTTTGRLSWNIPLPPDGCSSDALTYCGIVITVDDIGADRDTVGPQNGTKYSGDPTADRDLHMGDKLGTALVVAAIYEPVKKGTGEELTTYVDITGLTEDGIYYFNGYADDCQFNYCADGIYAYSLEKCLTKTDGDSGFVNVTYKEEHEGTDGTGLNLNQEYSMLMEVDRVEYTIVINGSDAQTFDAMVEAINNEIEKLSEAPESVVPPNTGAYYYNQDTGQLFQWDGHQYDELPVLNEPTDPTALAVGDYWHDTDAAILYKWDGSDWVVVPNTDIVSFAKDPTNESGLTNSDYWYRPGSPSAAFAWCGNTWDQQTLFDQETDPSAGIDADCGSYWYNTADLLLRHWNEQQCAWEETDAIYWDVDPHNPTTGTYWYNDEDGTLSQWDTPVTSIWNPLGKSYVDFNLNIAHISSDLGLAPNGSPNGVYNEEITIAGVVYDIEVNVCNETEGRFDRVYESINEQLGGAATIDFLGDEPSTKVRLLSSDESKPIVSAGGNLFKSLTDSDYEASNTTTTADALVIGDEPDSPTANMYWINNDGDVFQRNAGNTDWDPLCTIVAGSDPTEEESGQLWWNSDEDNLYIWDPVNSAWVLVDTFIQSDTDPTSSVTLENGTVWYNSSTDVMSIWDGTQWVETEYMSATTDPTEPNVGSVWTNPETEMWYEWNGTEWIEFNPVDSPEDPSQSAIETGTYWYNTSNKALSIWNGTNWVSVMYSSTSVAPETGDQWYDLSTNTLMEWDGTSWVEGEPIALVTTADSTTIIFTSTTIGDLSFMDIGRTQADNEIFFSFSPRPTIGCPHQGTNGLSCLPSYEQEDIGDDGSEDERLKLISELLEQLGHPVVEVELTQAMLNKAINVALHDLRQYSGAAYRRGFMQLYIRGGQQIYKLTKSTAESDYEGEGYELADGEYSFDKIVQVMGIFRITSAFLTSAHGSGVFGQVVLQQLYNMGTFDLLSYYSVSQYIEQLEHLFASRLTFNWNETARSLTIHQPFPFPETVLMDVAVERTEQDLLTDRFTGRWVERYALAHCKRMLAQIRGKYGSLPGAGGGVSLNASDLNQEAADEIEKLLQEVADYVVNNAEEYGQHAEFIIG